MAAPYPKPDDERVNRNPPKFGWTDLPAGGRLDAAPKLPPTRKWHSQTRAWWRRVWASPQAVAWDQSGETMVPFAAVMDDLISGRVDAVKASPEIRQHQDRHGMNPKAMLQLRWRIVDEVAVPVPVKSAGQGGTQAGLRKRRGLEVVDGGSA